MFGLESLDMMIGLVTIYLTLALACTAIVEAMAAWLNVRSKNLDAALQEFLAGELKINKAFVKAFYAHPLVQALSKEANGIPSYIPPQVIGQVVQALITENDPSMSIKNAVDKLPGTVEDNRIKGLLMTLVTQVDGDAEKFRKAVEIHFDAAMDRASGWVKRHQQKIAFGVAFIFVVSSNIDTFTLATTLSSSPELRAKLVKIAEQQPEQKQIASADKDITKAEPANANPSNTQPQSPSDVVENANQKTQEALEETNRAIDNLKSSGLVFGWKDEKQTQLTFTQILHELSIMKMLGLLITIFAVSLGAPFWFDVLQRFMQVRQTGTSPREKEEKGKNKASISILQ